MEIISGIFIGIFIARIWPDEWRVIDRWFRKRQGREVV
jgi:hypothetical protein